jgi:hypothetical protein
LCEIPGEDVDGSRDVVVVIVVLLGGSVFVVVVRVLVLVLPVAVFCRLCTSFRRWFLLCSTRRSVLLVECILRSEWSGAILVGVRR